MNSLDERVFHVDDRVRLHTDMPYLELRAGATGQVCSIWCSQPLAYEVEFLQPGLRYGIRAILEAEQLEPAAKHHALAVGTSSIAQGI